MFFGNTTSPWNTTLCESIDSGRRYLTQTQLTGLLVVDAIIMVLSLLVNIAVIYGLVSTKQIINVPLRLILYLSISDCVLAVLLQPLFLAMLTVFADSQNCIFEHILQFVHIMFAHIPGCIIILITLERYLRMKYLQKYSTVVQIWKVHVAVGIVILFSFLQGVFYLIGTFFNVYNEVSFAGIIIDTCLIMSVFVAYFMMILIVRRQKGEVAHQQVLNDIDKILTQLATKILITIAILYFPYLVLTVMRSVYFDYIEDAEVHNWLNFGLILSYVLTFSNSFANAVIFLSTNKKSRMKIIDSGREMLRRASAGISLYSVTESTVTSV